MIGQYLANKLAAKLDDEEVHGVLQHHSAEALEEAGDAFLLEDGGEAVGDPLVSEKYLVFSIRHIFKT